MGHLQGREPTFASRRPACHSHGKPVRINLTYTRGSLLPSKRSRVGGLSFRGLHPRAPHVNLLIWGQPQPSVSSLVLQGQDLQRLPLA